jgi:hypothetical protein
MPSQYGFDYGFDWGGSPLVALPTVYRSIDVLEIEPNRQADIGEGFSRSVAVFDPVTTAPLVTDRAGVSITQKHAWSLAIEGRPDIAAFLAFRDRRHGRQVSFWVPSWTRDFQPVQDVVDGDTGMTVADRGYAQFVFPALPRQYIAIIQAGPSFLYRKITAATTNGVTESLTLDEALPDLKVGEYMVCFLSLVRFDNDDVELVWQTPEFLEVILELTELPKEVPA